MIIEPFLRYSENDSSNALSESSGDETSVGVGIFRIKNAGEDFSIYYGARLAYLSETTTSSSVLGFGNVVLVTQARAKLEGHSIAPTVGFQYDVLSHLAVGAEIGWSTSKIDGNMDVSPDAGQRYLSLDSQGTFGNIVLRYFF